MQKEPSFSRSLSILQINYCTVFIRTIALYLLFTLEHIFHSFCESYGCIGILLLFFFFHLQTLLNSKILEHIGIVIVKKIIG